MFNQKHRLSFLAFLCSLMMVFAWQSNVFSHEKLLDRHILNKSIDPVIAQQSEEVQIKTIPVRDNIYMLTGDGGNIGVAVGNDGAVMIDSQFARLSTKIQKAIADINNQPIRYLINSHYHFDHTDGNENFANAGVTIIAHNNVPKQMAIAHEYSVLQMKTKASPPKALPKITFGKDFTLNWNNNSINVFHIPLAHTDGDVVIHFKKENVIHTGDLFFNGFYPFIDTTVGGSIDGMIAAIDRILTVCNKDTLIIPGHGNLARKKDLIAFQDMLKTVSHRVKMSMRQNMSLEDMIKANLLKDLDAKWGKGFLSSEQFLTIAYQGINK